MVNSKYDSNFGPQFVLFSQAVGLKYNIKIDLREIGWVGVNWNRPPQDRDQRWALVNMQMNIWVSQHFGKFLRS
jgi:hypothetical protein